MDIPSFRSLIETTEALGSEHLNWFWFNAKTNEIYHINDGTHTLHALYYLGLNMSGIKDPDSLDDDRVLKRAINNNWVRGRYGYAGVPYQQGKDYDPWNKYPDLALQGKRRDVQKAAKFIATKWPFETLIVDFAEGDNIHNDMGGVEIGKGTTLKGGRLDFFMKRGTVPSDMVMENSIQVHGADFDGPVEYFTNPSLSTFMKQLREHGHARGFFDIETQNLYVWHAPVLHSDMDEIMGDFWLTWNEPWEGELQVEYDTESVLDTLGIEEGEEFNAAQYLLSHRAFKNVSAGFAVMA